MAIGYQEQRERIVQDFEQNKLELKAAVQDLTDNMRGKIQSARHRVSLRNQIGDHPVPWLAGGFGLGLLLGIRKWLGRSWRRVGF